MNCELINTEGKDGFTIRFYACEEGLSIRDSFDLPEEDMQKLIEDIDSGNLNWFCAKVTASKNGIELASDYLGGCCYKNANEFLTNNDYYADMVDKVIIEAKEAIKKLVA